MIQRMKYSMPFLVASPKKKVDCSCILMQEVLTRGSSKIAKDYAG